MRCFPPRRCPVRTIMRGTSTAAWASLICCENTTSPVTPAPSAFFASACTTPKSAPPRCRNQRQAKTGQQTGPTNRLGSAPPVTAPPPRGGHAGRRSPRELANHILAVARPPRRRHPQVVQHVLGRSHIIHRHEVQVRRTLRDETLTHLGGDINPDLADRITVGDLIASSGLSQALEDLHGDPTTRQCHLAAHGTDRCDRHESRNHGLCPMNRVGGG